MKKVGSDMIEIKVEKIIGEDGESIFKANPNKISIGGMLASYVDKIHITIPDEWKGCAVRITFVPRYAVPVARLIDENGYLDITKDLTIRSRGSIVIDAQNGDYAAYSTDIEYTAYDHQRAGTASGKPSPNEYEQMINIAKSAVKSVNNILPDQNGNVNVDAQQVQQVQSDWNQNDETQPDYVKNRPGGYTVVTKKGVDIKWDGVIGDREYIDNGGGILLVKVSDEVLTSEQLSGAEIIQTMTDGVQTITQSFTIDGNKLAYNSGILTEQGSFIFMVVGEQATATFGYSSGTYILHMVDSSETMYVSSIYKQDETGIVPIPAEYIDDAIQRVGADVIIPSSAPGSTKKFKITVDDSGTISATEV